MSKKEIVLLPRLKRILQTLGENIKLARLRRKYSAEQVAERANVSRYTIWQIEKGATSVSIGSYLQVLFILGMENDLKEVATNDILGRKLQDAAITIAKRAPKRKTKL